MPVVALVYFIALNFIGFVLCGLDKSRARKGRWRISETALLMAGLLGGAFGLALGMAAFRHKTKHLKFKIIVLMECVLWAVVIIYMLKEA